MTWKKQRVGVYICGAYKIRRRKKMVGERAMWWELSHHGKHLRQFATLGDARKFANAFEGIQ